MHAMTKRAIIVVVSLALSGIAAAHALWIEDGVPVVVETGLQWYHRIVSDGGGGAIVAWSDERAGEYQKDIYAQRIDGAGAMLWVNNGTVVCTADNVQWAPELCGDGHGGVVVTWADYRGGAADIYAQHIDSSGAAQWTADGVGICSAVDEQRYPEIVSDGSGGAIIVWEDWRAGEFAGYDIYAQRIDAGGAVRWTADGVGICTAAGFQSFQKAIADGSGGAIIVWQDTRGGYPGGDIYTQRVDSLGNVLWAADGVAVCAVSGDHYAPEIAADGFGGAVVAWTDERDGDRDIYAQRFDENGNVLWAAGGVGVCTRDSTQWFPVVVADGAGGAVVSWTDKRGGDYDIYAQRLGIFGDALWEAGGLLVCAAADDQGSTEYGYGLQMAADGGGAIIAWQDKRGGFYCNVYAQKISAGGDPQWPADGVPVGTSVVNRADPRLVGDLCGGAIIAWLAGWMTNSDIYAARLDQTGQPVATLLQGYDVVIDACGVVLTWTLSDTGGDMRFIIQRTDVASDVPTELADERIVRDGLSFSFLDEGGEPGRSYRYRVDIDDDAGRRVLFETDPVTVPAAALLLYQNHPNPFNPSTTIRYYLPERSRVVLDVYDTRGMLIARLVDCELDRGKHRAEWSGVDAHGVPVASGVYFYRLAAGKETISRKMILLR